MSPSENTFLAEHAKKALKYAHAPYSDFRVGAALQTRSGKIYSGCNIEVSSYGLTMCAERVAMFKALSEGETEFRKIVVTADTKEFCPPCGACRQVLADFAPHIKIVLLNAAGDTKETTIADLLPEAFSEKFLKSRK